MHGHKVQPTQDKFISQWPTSPAKVDLMLFAFDKRMLICLGKSKRSLRFLILTEFICGFRVPSGRKEKGQTVRARQS